LCGRKKERKEKTLGMNLVACFTTPPLLWRLSPKSKQKEQKGKREKGKQEGSLVTLRVVE